MSGELIYGIHAIEAALTHDPGNILELYIEGDSHNARLKELSERAREAGVKPHARDKAALDKMGVVKGTPGLPDVPDWDGSKAAAAK